MTRRGTTPAKETIALVIGIEAYRKNIPTAVGAKTDAQTFAEYAERTFGIKRDRIRLLTDDGATKSAIEAHLGEWLPKNVKPGSDVWVYFSGHGTPDPLSKEQHLLPWEADPAFIASQGIPLKKLFGALAKLKSAHTFVLLDACFTGTGKRSVSAPGRPVVALLPPPVEERSRLLVFSAAGANETANVTEHGGLFSESLFLGLSGEADANKDGTIRWDEWIGFTRSRVIEKAHLMNGEQHPEAQGTGSLEKNLAVATLDPKDAPRPVEAMARLKAAKAPSASSSGLASQPPPAAPRPPPSSSPLAVGALVVGVAGLAVSLAAGGWALERKGVVRSQCPGKQCKDQAGVDAASLGSTLTTVSTVSFVVGAAGVGIWLVWPSPEEGSTAAGGRFRLPLPGLRGMF